MSKAPSSRFKMADGPHVCQLPLGPPSSPSMPGSMGPLPSLSLQRLFSSGSKCKSNLLLINTARGGLIDEEALIDALNTKNCKRYTLNKRAYFKPFYFSLYGISFVAKEGFNPLNKRRSLLGSLEEPSSHLGFPISLTV